MPSIAKLPTGMAVGIGTSEVSLDFCGRDKEVKNHNKMKVPVILWLSTA